MSALAKPLIHSVNVLSGQSDPVNVEEIQTMTRVVNENTGINAPAQYHLSFGLRAHDQNPKSMTWKFADETALDDAYAAILALASTAV